MVEGLTFFSSPTKGSCQEGSGFHRVNATEGRGTAEQKFRLIFSHRRKPASRSRRHYITHQDPGDSSGEATPVPIPNTEVKLSSAEDTQGAAPRENRSSPGSFALCDLTLRCAT